MYKLLPGAEQGPALVFEAARYAPGDAAGSPGEFSFVRIASLRSGDEHFELGVFSFAPLEQQGCEAKFHHIRLGEKDQTGA